MQSVRPNAPSNDRRFASAVDARRQAMLRGPIATTLVRFATPTVAVVTIQSLVVIMQTYFVGLLGTEALAGVALVFPVTMLMQMMSASGIGGGVASALARAFGAGRRSDVNELTLHSLVIAAALGGAFTLAALFWGRPLYRMLGGRGQALEVAVTYSNVVFAGNIAMWLFNTLSAILRGFGDMVLPAKVSVVGAIALVPLSALLVFGWGPLPGLGVAGAGLAFVLYYFAAAIILVRHVLSGAQTRLTLRGFRLQSRHLRDILVVGGASAFMTAQANLIMIILTGLVSAFGTAALAGFGLATRLDYILVPLLFGLGSAAVTLVATNLGAGQVERARRIAWTAVAIGAGATEIIGLAVALAPNLWLGTFTRAADVLNSGGLYLRTVGPFYGCFGAGMILYFCAQGAGKMLWPLLGGVARLLVATLGAWIVVRHLGVGLAGLTVMVAASYAVFAAINAMVFRAMPSITRSFDLDVSSR